MASSQRERQGRRADRGPIDTTFLIIVLILVAIGLITMFSASYANAYYLRGNSLHYILRQLPAALFGIFVMTVASHFDYRFFKKLSVPIYVGSLALLVVALFMPEINGAHRWIFLGSLNFQPSEISKFAVVILFATIICKCGPQMATFRGGILRFVLLLLPTALLMLLEPHISGTVLIVSLGAVLIFIGGANVLWFAGGAALVLGFGAIVVMNPELLDKIAVYAGDRVEIWLDPWSDPLGKGFQTVQSLYAIGSGGIMGAGIGASRQKYLYLPEPYNDFIFAIICEEMGFVGAVVIILLFILLIWRGFVIATRCSDRFGALVAAGLTAQVGIQAILNIAVVTNTIPNTGISLPFFSYGGTSLVMLLGEMGIILSISRRIPIEKQ